MQKILLIQLALLPEYRGVRTIPVLWEDTDCKIEPKDPRDWVFSGVNRTGTHQPGWLKTEIPLHHLITNPGVDGFQFDYLQMFIIGDPGSEPYYLQEISMEGLGIPPEELLIFNAKAFDNALEVMEESYRNVIRELNRSFVDNNVHSTSAVDLDELWEKHTDIPEDLGDVDEECLTEEAKFILDLQELSRYFYDDNNGNSPQVPIVFTREKLNDLIEENGDFKDDDLELIMDEYFMPADEEHQPFAQRKPKGQKNNGPGRMHRRH